MDIWQIRDTHGLVPTVKLIRNLAGNDTDGMCRMGLAHARDVANGKISFDEGLIRSKRDRDSRRITALYAARHQHANAIDRIDNEIREIREGLK